MAATALGIVSADAVIGDLIESIAYNAYATQNTSALDEEIADIEWHISFEAQELES